MIIKLTLCIVRVIVFTTYTINPFAPKQVDIGLDNSINAFVPKQVDNGLDDSAEYIILVWWHKDD